MKKVFILIGLLLAITNIANAEQQGVVMDIHNKSIPDKNLSIDRAPMRMPILVFFDTDTHIISVYGKESMEAEVFLYSENGNLIGYSSILNTEFEISAPGIYIIQIHWGVWYAEGEIEI